jgi:hypothetical protein
MDTEIGLLALTGMSKEELATRVVEHVAAQLLVRDAYDEDGEPCGTQSTQFERALQQRIKDHLDAEVGRQAEKHVLPKVTDMVERLVLQKTNQWGEKTGKPVTFIEYLVERAEHYLTEKVNHNGKTREEDSYSWRENTSRISYLVHKHLQYSIKIAMEEAVSEANKSITGGLEKAVKISLQQVIDKLKVQVKT